jgi:hypothetical protein
VLLRKAADDVAARFRDQPVAASATATY